MTEIEYDWSVCAYLYRGGCKDMKVQFRRTAVAYARIEYPDDNEDEIMNTENWYPSPREEDSLEKNSFPEGVRCMCSHILRRQKNFFFITYKSSQAILIGSECIIKNMGEEMAEYFRRLIKTRTEIQKRNRAKAKFELNALLRTILKDKIRKRDEAKRDAKFERCLDGVKRDAKYEKCINEMRTKTIKGILSLYRLRHQKYRYPKPRQEPKQEPERVRCSDCPKMIEKNDYKTRCIECWKKTQQKKYNKCPRCDDKKETWMKECSSCFYLQKL